MAGLAWLFILTADCCIWWLRALVFVVFPFLKPGFISLPVGILCGLQRWSVNEGWLSVCSQYPQDRTGYDYFLRLSWLGAGSLLTQEWAFGLSVCFRLMWGFILRQPLCLYRDEAGHPLGCRPGLLSELYSGCFIPTSPFTKARSSSPVLTGSLLDLLVSLGQWGLNLWGHIADILYIRYLRYRIHNIAKLKVWGSNEIILCLGLSTTCGTVSKGRRIRKVENCCSRATSAWTPEPACPSSCYPNT